MTTYKKYPGASYDGSSSVVVPLAHTLDEDLMNYVINGSTGEDSERNKRTLIKRKGALKEFSAYFSDLLVALKPEARENLQVPDNSDVIFPRVFATPAGLPSAPSDFALFDEMYGENNEKLREALKDNLLDSVTWAGISRGNYWTLGRDDHHSTNPQEGLSVSRYGVVSVMLPLERIPHPGTPMVLSVYNDKDPERARWTMDTYDCRATGKKVVDDVMVYLADLKAKPDVANYKRRHDTESTSGRMVYRKKFDRGQLFTSAQIAIGISFLEHLFKHGIITGNFKVEDSTASTAAAAAAKAAPFAPTFEAFIRALATRFGMGDDSTVAKDIPEMVHDFMTKKDYDHDLRAYDNLVNNRYNYLINPIADHCDRTKVIGTYVQTHAANQTYSPGDQVFCTVNFHP